jgi:hypothetical protein
MKNKLYIAIVALLTTGAMANASSNRGSRYVQGTVVKVQQHRMQSPDYAFGAGNPSDAPLTSRYYGFDVVVRVGCTSYVGHYETAFNYLPSIFTPDGKIEMRLTKRVMYFDLPNYPDFRIGIVHRKRACGTNR